MRILEVVSHMQVGGIERWLLDVAAEIDRGAVEIDFACRTIGEEPRRRLASLGCRIHLVPDLQHAGRGLASLRALQRQYRYDAIHTHLHHMSGMVLWMARWAGFRTRIAHSHLDSRPAERRAGRRFLARNAVLSALIRRHATAGLACGADAAASLYGAGWRSDPRWRVLLYGIDLSPFRQAMAGNSATSVRRELSIPADAFVVGHVGRFVAQKNHQFFVTIAAEIVRRRPSTHFLLLGDGPLRPDIERRIAEAGLGDRCHMVTDRTDVATFTPAMDAFLFPSVFEGLGIALVEAQATGLPCIFTETLPQEATVVPHLAHRRSLDEPASVWADAVLAVSALTLDRAAALEAVERSPFNVRISSRHLSECYAREIGDERPRRRYAEDRPTHL